jgi:hypothetical protein
VGKHGWQTMRALGPDGINWEFKIMAQNIPVQEQDRVQRLILCRSCNMFVNREMC